MARKNIYLGLAGRLEQYLCGMPRGEMLPPEQELADLFQVSKPTLRRALALLRQDGCIRSQNGVGTTLEEVPETLRKELVFVCADLVFFADTLKKFSEECAKNNYICSIVPLSGDPEMQIRILRSVFRRSPAGIVLYPGNQNSISDFSPECKVPLLHLIRRRLALSGDLLTFQNGDAVADIVRRFYAEGCRRIALFDQTNSLAAEERFQGFLAGLHKVRLRPRSELICRTAADHETFFACFRSEGSRPHAVCCLNDLSAGDFFREMRKRGLPAGGIRVSGFDCSPVTAFYPQPILTVRPPLEELGRRAAELLIRRIENPGLAPFSEKLESELVVAETFFMKPDSQSNRKKGVERDNKKRSGSG